MLMHRRNNRRDSAAKARSAGTGLGVGPTLAPASCLRSFPEEASLFELLPHVFRSHPAKSGACLTGSDHPSNCPLRLSVVDTGHLCVAQYPSDRRRIVKIAKNR